MSFSSDVKEELETVLGTKQHCLLAELCALLSLNGKIVLEEAENGQVSGKLILRGENPSVTRKLFTLLKKAYNIENECLDEGQNKLEISLPDKALELTEETDLLSRPCCKRSFLRGTFLSVGSINDPQKSSYHLEMVFSEKEQAYRIRDILQIFDISSRVIMRKANYVVYMKEGETISDFLNVIEAHVSLMNFENHRIMKDMRNSVNRRVNCETANINKTVKAAAKQTEDIRFLMAQPEYKDLPDPLKDACEVRLANPDASLKELGELMHPPVGKSGINHRLMKICEIAEQIRDRNGLGGDYDKKDNDD